MLIFENSKCIILVDMIKFMLVKENDLNNKNFQAGNHKSKFIVLN